MKIKAITLWQPWASFMALDLKKNEPRSWGTEYRGSLAIHAAWNIHAQEIPNEVFKLALEKIGPMSSWPRGRILCVRDLFKIERDPAIPADPIEAMLGLYGSGRVAWHTKLLHVFDEPIQANGHQRLWNWEWPD